MTTDRLGLYVHIPFCVSKCNYCDFASFSGISRDVRNRYVARIIEEIQSYKNTPAIEIDTIFFGGGTPSLLTASEFDLIVDSIRDTFSVAYDCEFTIEANPKTFSLDKAHAFASRGVNRMSFGLQSIHENELKSLGRIHLFSDLINSVAMAREVGINNISIDVMYGIPYQSIESFSETLSAVVALKPDHISAYGLILEEHTPFWDVRDSLPLPTEDEECEMYDAACRILGNAGYSHYEISNYARPGFECKHNLKYWRDEMFIGVGLSAYSYYADERYGNSSKFSEYLSENFIQYRRGEKIDSASFEVEYIMMHLRLKEGFDVFEYARLFGKNFVLGREEVIDKYSLGGYLCIDNNRIFLTEKGYYISNSIISELI